MLYQAHAMYMEAIQPLNRLAKTARYFHSHPLNPFHDYAITRHITAGCELFERLTAYYEKPSFDIQHTVIDGQQVTVREEVVLSKPYMNLLHFRKEVEEDVELEQPRLLIVAPLSGHYATLLRNTVIRLLPEVDIYITDWLNAREVPIEAGAFHLDDFVRYTMKCLKFCGENTHVLAICQPTVPVIMALSVMSESKSPYIPSSTTLIAGPVDTRINPSEVNDYASNHDYEWFENNVIFTVPSGFTGAGQRVYPGFMQLSGFLSLNLSEHIRKHTRFYHDLVKNDGDSSEAHRKFYNEYLAVLDMSAPFYLETIKRVFIDVDLPQGNATYFGERIDTGAVTDTALFTIEGAEDDICGLGQTEAAHRVLKNIPDDKRQHYVQPWVGHYGAWNGRHFRETVAPKIIDFIHRHDKASV